MKSESESHSVVSDSATPWTIQSMEFSRPEYWSRYPFPSLGDLPNPGIEFRSPALHENSLPVYLPNPGIEPRSRALEVGSLPAEPQGKPRTLEWVSMPFSSRSSRPRSRTGVSCIAGGFFTNWAIREAQRMNVPSSFSFSYKFNQFFLNSS